MAIIIHKGYVQRMNMFFGNDPEQNCWKDYKLTRTSALVYSTATEMGQPPIGQDGEVAGATSEVLSFNYCLCGKPTVIQQWKVYVDDGILQRDLQA